MRKNIFPLDDFLISLTALALNLAFTYAMFFEIPYCGFDFNPSTGDILEIFVEADPAAALREDDIIQKIGDISWSRYRSDATQVFFENAQAGDIVAITVLRNGGEVEIPWVFPGFNNEEFKARFVNVWWLAYVFWAFGSLTRLVIRPRDARTRLLTIANLLTGFWLIVGSVSAWQIWGSSLILHAVTWLLLPVYIHLHWVFPKPLKETSGWAWVLFYLAGFALAFGELAQALPRQLYALGFLVMLAGSIVLLIAHAIWLPVHRKETRLLGIVIIVASLPGIFLSISSAANRIPQLGPLGLVTLPIIPGAYFYIVYRQRLGGMEMRANRAVSVYAFMILVGVIVLALVSLAALSLLDEPGALIVLSVIAVLVAAYASLAGFPAFQSFVERRLMGIRLPYQRLPEMYSSSITTSASMAELLRLLENEIFPSLLVRQFAFLQLSGETFAPLLLEGVDAPQLPNRDDLTGLVSLAGRFRLPEEGQPHPWIRLILTLRAGEETLGFWLLGRRDPDDLYHAAEIPIFQSLADQTAIAVSNLLQTERLRSLYQLNIERREQERLRLALELHDSVLNELAALRMNLGETDPSPRFQEAYEKVVQRLREIVSDLRPPMLNYGLKLALEELSQDLMERSENRARVSLAMFGEDERYPSNIELHLFRIVQEACENALRHAKAANVVVSAQLDASGVSLEIEDDGLGFEMGERMELNDLLARNHFGLAGIVERANLIGARVVIRSTPKTGTRIRVVWRAPAKGQG